MTEEDRTEIKRLAAIAGEKEVYARSWDAVNVYGQTADVLRDIYGKSALARADAMEARVILDRFIDKAIKDGLQ